MANRMVEICSWDRYWMAFVFPVNQLLAVFIVFQ